MDFKLKYLKYKNKYINLKNQIGGINKNIEEFKKLLKKYKIIEKYIQTGLNYNDTMIRVIFSSLCAALNENMFEEIQKLSDDEFKKILEDENIKNFIQLIENTNDDIISKFLLLCKNKIALKIINKLCDKDIVESKKCDIDEFMTSDNDLSLSLTLTFTP